MRCANCWKEILEPPPNSNPETYNEALWTGIGKDIPPFSIAIGKNSGAALNVIVDYGGRDSTRPCAAR